MLNETMKGCFVMRSVFRSVLVALVAVLAFGAVAASGASAHEWLVPCHKVSEANKGKGSFGNAGCTEAGGSKEYSESILAGESFAVAYEGGLSTLTWSGGREITCGSVHGEGSVGPEGKGKIGELVYTGCKVIAPSGCGFVASPGEPNGTVVMSGLPTKLVTPGVHESPGSVVEVEQNPVTKLISKYDVEKFEGSEIPCSLPFTNQLYGSFVGHLNNTTETLEFAGMSGVKPLIMRGASASYSEELGQRLVGGGKLEGT